MPRRDRRNQQRPERPNRHRDPSVLNEQAPQAAPAVVEAPAVNDKQLRVELVDAPRPDVMPTAMVVNIDQAKSEIVALNDNATVATPAVEVTAPADAPVEAAAAENVVEATLTAPVEEIVATEATSEKTRASNDPRQRRRQQRAAQSQQPAAQQLTPSQVPTLGQFTIGSLIRHVYGEDCSVLIEQFGLLPTFNRALEKFTKEYNASLVAAAAPAAAAEKKPVTRDVEVTVAKVEAEPAPVLDLNPPKPVSDKRVANDPRERRRLAKQAAEQALQQAKQQAKVEAAPAVETVPEPVAVEAPAEPVEAAVTEAPVASEAVVETTENTQPTEPATETAAPVEVTTEVAPAEVQVEEAAPAEASAETEAPVAKSKDVAEATVEEAEASEAEKAEKQAARPRRPRGRPPKKANTATES